jgi:hypothetical protein
MCYFIHRIPSIAHGSHMQFLHLHFCMSGPSVDSIRLSQLSSERRTILCQRSSLVAEQVLDSSQLLGKSAGSHDCTRDFWVVLDLMGIDGFAHIEIYSQTVRDQSQSPSSEADTYNR